MYLNSDQSIKLIIKAADFAALHHRKQRRKGLYNIPYINHPIRVAQVLSESIASPGVELLTAALLHDIIEDTKITPEELSNEFGEAVLTLVLEVTDQPGFNRSDRWEAQVSKAPTLSKDAKKIKIADKICNMRDILVTPLLWPSKQRLKYFRWARRVVDGCRGCSAELEQLFDKVYEEGIKKWDR